MSKTELDCVSHHPSITGIARCWMPCRALPAKRLLTHCSTTNNGSVGGEGCNVETGREGMVSKWLKEDGKERLSTNRRRTKFSWIGVRWSLKRTLLPQMGRESCMIFYLGYYCVGSKHAIIGLGNTEYMVWGEVRLHNQPLFILCLWPNSLVRFGGVKARTTTEGIAEARAFLGYESVWIGRYYWTQLFHGLFLAAVMLCEWIHDYAMIY